MWYNIYMKKITLSINLNEIEKAKVETNKITSYDTLGNFYKENPYCQKIGSQIWIIEQSFLKSIKNKTGIQSCSIEEMISYWFLCKQYNLENYIIKSTDIQYRYVASNDDLTICYCGQPDKKDILFYQGKVLKTYEVKNKVARTGDIDLTIDNDGYILSKTQFTDKLNKYLTSLNRFDLSHKNLALPAKYCNELANRYIDDCDNFLIIDDNYLYVLTKEEYSSQLKITGEIRGQGKNWKNVSVNDNHFNAFLDGLWLDNEKVKIPINNFEPRTKSRGKNSFSKWRRFYNHYRLYDKDVIEETDEYIICYRNKIQINSINISAHAEWVGGSNGS